MGKTAARTNGRLARAFLALACLLVAACARGGAADSARPVRIGYFASLGHAQAVLGVASGDFAAAVAPAALETRLFDAGPSLVEALFAGEIDVGYVGPGPALAAHARSYGEGIRVVAGGAANGVVVVAREGSGIRAMADLAGRRIGTPQLGNTQDISARHYLQSVLGETDLGNVVPVENAQQAAMFARGELDAAWVPEPWGARLCDETGATIVAEEKDLWPSREFALTLVVTTPELLAKRPDVVARVLEVHRAWTRRLREEPAEQVAPLGDAIESLTGKRLPHDVLARALGRVAFTDEPHEETLRTFASWTHDLGFDARAAGTERLVDATLLRAQQHRQQQQQQLLPAEAR